MGFTLFVLLSLIVIAGISAAPTEVACPGGYKEGEKVEKDSAWYECRSGQLVAKGCLAPNGDRLKLQDAYDLGNIRSRCVQGDNGNPILVQKSCLQDNQEHQPEEQWDDSKYVYTCKKEGNDIKMIATGCIRLNKRMNIGEKMAIDDAVYECKKDAASEFPTFAAWGCAAEDGSQHPHGGSFEVGQYWYTCENKNNVISLRLSGCVSDGKRFTNGDRIYKDDVTFECQAIGGGVNLKVVGCMQEDHPGSGRKIERRVGCYWSEGTLPYQVTMTCAPDQQRKTAVATPLHCDYRMRGTGTTYNIDIGCYRLFEDVAVGCTKDATGKVTAVPLKVNEKGDGVENVPSGLSFC